MARIFTRRTIAWAAALSLLPAMLDMPRAAAANDPDERIQIAGLDVAIWKPSGSTGPFPLVLFSHGLYGCKIQSSYLMRALAEHGMLVAAPDHADMYSGCPQALPDPPLPPQGFLDPRNWTPTFYVNRGDNLQDLRRALETDATHSVLIDPDRVALVGHSLGGYTVLGLAGAWPTWKMDKITAVVALASFAEPLVRNGTLANVSVPVLVQGGTADFLAPATDQNGVYAAIAGHGCKVIYEGADHFAWTDREAGFHDVTAAATVAFLTAAFAGQRPTTAVLPSSTAARPECK